MNDVPSATDWWPFEDSNERPYPTAGDWPAERRTLVLGVDPGPVVGLCALYPNPDTTGRYAQSVLLVRAGPESALRILSWWSAEWLADGTAWVQQRRMAVVCERFVDGRRAARVAGRHGSQAAKDLIGALRHSYPHLHTRAAADVKPWASAARVKAAGIEIANPTTMRHALDAGRHALYAAVWDYGWPDPLAHGGRAVRGG